MILSLAQLRCDYLTCNEICDLDIFGMHFIIPARYVGNSGLAIKYFFRTFKNK